MRHGLATEHTLSIYLYMTVRVMASPPGSSVLTHPRSDTATRRHWHWHERTSTGVTDLGPHTLALARSEVDWSHRDHPQWAYYIGFVFIFEVVVDCQQLFTFIASVRPGRGVEREVGGGGGSQCYDLGFVHRGYGEEWHLSRRQHLCVGISVPLLLDQWTDRVA